MKIFLLVALLPLLLLAQCPNDQYCLSCSGTNCLSCIYTFLDKDGVCKSPSTSVNNCVTYSSSTQCQTCDMGYYLTGNTCNKITVKRCALVNPQNPDICLACKNGNLLVDNVCTKYTKCYDYNCKICNGSRNCIECQKYYSVDSTGVCVPDPVDGCARTGTSAKDCAQCQRGYYSAGAYCRITDAQKSSAYIAGAIACVIALLMF